MAEVLECDVKSPDEVDPDQISDYDLVGFGSGIYSADLHKKINKFVDSISKVEKKKAFIFSTNGAPGNLADDKMIKKQKKENHSRVQQKLEAKGFEVIDDFTCPGFNTNSFIKFFGGLNKGRPNKEDLRNAEAFAQRIRRRTGSS